jgi:hypothetical protein
MFCTRPAHFTLRALASAFFAGVRWLCPMGHDAQVVFVDDGQVAAEPGGSAVFV